VRRRWSGHLDLCPLWWSEEGAGGVGEGGVFEAAAGDFEVDLGGGEVDVAQEALDFGEGGAGVDEEGGVGVAARAPNRPKSKSPSKN
jgi:hypothetical protein